MKHATYTELYEACRRVHLKTLNELKVEAMINRWPPRVRPDDKQCAKYSDAFYEVTNAVFAEREKAK